MIAVFDTETTGLRLPSTAPLEHKPRIIEIAVVLINRGKVYQEHSWLLNPGVPISAEITKITGLTNDDLKDKPCWKDLYQEIAKPFMNCEVVIGHNITFDIDMVENEMRRVAAWPFPFPQTRLCTVSMYDYLQGWRHSQTALYERIIGKPCKQTHRALDDVKQLVEILKKDKVFAKLEKA